MIEHSTSINEFDSILTRMCSWGYIDDEAEGHIGEYTELNNFKSSDYLYTRPTLIDSTIYKDIMNYINGNTDQLIFVKECAKYNNDKYTFQAMCIIFEFYKYVINRYEYDLIKSDNDDFIFACRLYQPYEILKIFTPDNNLTCEDIYVNDFNRFCLDTGYNICISYDELDWDMSLLEIISVMLKDRDPDVFDVSKVIAP